jgi:hypothetical protein
MTGFCLNPSPPMAVKTVFGKFGVILHVVIDDSRSMTSQVSVLGSHPPQMRSLERPLSNKQKLFYKWYPEIWSLLYVNCK